MCYFSIYMGNFRKFLWHSVNRLRLLFAIFWGNMKWFILRKFYTLITFSLVIDFLCWVYILWFLNKSFRAFDDDYGLQIFGQYRNIWFGNFLVRIILFNYCLAWLVSVLILSSACFVGKNFHLLCCNEINCLRVVIV